MSGIEGSRGSAPFLLGVFLVCMCGLMLQVVETRIMSVIAFYHLAFFAISMGMLGMTAGSLLVYFKPHLFPPERLFGNLAWGQFGAGRRHTVFHHGAGHHRRRHRHLNTYAMTALVWFKLILILLPPYVFAGMAVSLALTRGPVPVGLVYGVDLLGASSGCLVVLLLLSWADAISLLLAVAAFAAAGAVCFQRAQRVSGEAPSTHVMSRLGQGGWPVALAVLLAVFAVANASVQPTVPDQRSDGIVLLSSKGALELKRPSLVRWNTYSRIMVSTPAVDQPFLWSASPVTPERRIAQRC